MKSDVFSKLRLKLSISFMLVFAFVLVLLIGFLNVYLFLSNARESERFMDSLIDDFCIEDPSKKMAERDDVFGSSKFLNSQSIVKNPRYSHPSDRVPPPKPEEIFPSISESPADDNSCSWIEKVFPFKTTLKGFRNYYTAFLDKDGNTELVLQDFYDSISKNYEDILIKKILDLNKEKGTYGSYSFKIEPFRDGYILVILDRELEVNQQEKFAFTSVVLFMVSLLLVFIFSLILSRWATKPVEEAFSTQKRFIADASHELKTPIAVIDANVDVLLQDYPDNKWLGYIKTENFRMRKLVLDMLSLAKSDAGREKFDMLPFDIANAAALAVLPFESLAFEQNKNLILDEISKESIIVNGDESKIKQLVIILTDNALKNSDKNATIKISLVKENNRCILKVYNTGHGIAPEYRDKIFNRFYRVDSSRDRNTGGYGLGLSIAQTIAAAHHGRITVDSVVGEYAEFTFTMPCEK